MTREQEVVEAMRAIGFGRSMQLAESAWRDHEIAEGRGGGEHSSYCCAGFLVPCPGCAPARAAKEHCDWCCGAGRVTEKVSKTIVAIMLALDAIAHMRMRCIRSKENKTLWVFVDDIERILEGEKAQTSDIGEALENLKKAIENIQETLRGPEPPWGRPK